MSVVELMTAKMKALCIMTNISPYFHLKVKGNSFIT